MLKKPTKGKNPRSLKEHRAQSTEQRAKRDKSTEPGAKPFHACPQCPSSPTGPMVEQSAQCTEHRARSKTFPCMSPMSHKSHRSHGGARSRGRRKMASYSSDTATRWFWVLKKMYLSEIAGVERTGSPTLFSPINLNSGPACSKKTLPSLSAI
jgi:hypothetical protein